MVSATGEDFIEWNWNAVEGVSAYAVQVSTDEIFTDEDPVTRTSTTTHRESGIGAGATRYLRVASALVTDPENPLNPETTLLSAWTTTVIGTSDEPPPEAPATPTGLMVSATGEDFIEWSWNAVEGASAYAVQVSTDATFTDEDPFTRTSTTTHRENGIGTGATRYLRVASALVTDPEDPLNPETTLLSTWATPVAGTSEEPPPEPPATPTGLTVSATGEDFIEWSWDPVEGASAYAVQVSPDETFTDADPVTRTSTTTHRESGIGAGATRHLRVASALVTDPEDPLNPEATLLSTWATPVAGTSEEPPPEPPATPTGLMVSATGEDFIEWDWDAVRGVRAYAVQVSTNQTFTSTDPITLVRHRSEYRLDGLDPETTLYARVASAVITDPENPLDPETTLLSAWTEHVTGTTDDPPPPEPEPEPDLYLSGTGQHNSRIELAPGVWTVELKVTGNVNRLFSSSSADNFIVHIGSRDGGESLLANEIAAAWSGAVTLRVGRDGYQDIEPGRQLVTVDASGEWTITLLNESEAARSGRPRAGTFVPTSDGTLTLSGSGTDTRRLWLDPGLWTLTVELRDNTDTTFGFSSADNIIVFLDSVESGRSLLVNEIATRWSGSTTLWVGSGRDLASGVQILSVDASGTWRIDVRRR